jgi:hypothetical protein
MSILVDRALCASRRDQHKPSPRQVRARHGFARHAEAHGSDGWGKKASHLLASSARILSASVREVAWSFFALLSRHAHTVKTRQPRSRSARLFRLSRALFASILDNQYVTFVVGTLPATHRCPCQKHPWTKTTALYLGNTKSGRPGKLVTFAR